MESANKSIQPPGDRAPGIVQKIPASALYCHTGRMVLDVTRPPFNAKGDGFADDTAALCKAMAFVREHYPVAGFEGGRFCCNRKDRNWTIYLPNGTYLVSDTVCQGWPARAFNILHGWTDCRYSDVASPEEEQAIYDQTVDYTPHLHDDPRLLASDDNGTSYIRGQYASMEIYAEANWDIRIVGESREGTIIRLKDHAAGFDGAETKPILSNVLLQRGSNVNIGNFVENLTIHTGHDNPGAAALRWNSSNFGGIRNVALLSPDGARTGLLMDRNNATGYLRDIAIDGFQTGIRLCAGRETMVVLEYATIAATKMGIELGGAQSGGGGDSLDCRKILVKAPQPMVCRQAGQAIVLDSVMESSNPHAPAIIVQQDGFLMARRLQLRGTQEAAIVTPQERVAETAIEHFISCEPFRANDTWTEVPAKEVPEVDVPEDPSEWAVVDDYGAKGDGLTDDTEAIQRALDSGRRKLFFGSHVYLLNGSVHVPASVSEIDGMHTTVVRSKSLAFHTPALFVVSQPSPEPLLIRRFLSAGGVLVDHAALRPLVLEDLYVDFHHGRSAWAQDDAMVPLHADQQTEIWRCYRNPDRQGPVKEVFLNDCIMPTGDLADGSLAIENTRFYGRMIDSEHVEGGLYTFKNSTAWIFGFKSENTDTLAAAHEHSRLEILGGSLLEFSQKNGPVLISSDSSLSAIFYLWHFRIVPPQILSKDGEVLLRGNELAPLASEDATVLAVQ